MKTICVNLGSKLPLVTKSILKYGFFIFDFAAQQLC